MASSDQMHAIAHALNKAFKFRFEPFEWVYEGYKPLLLPSVMVHRCAAGR
jgi:hypothetical protein